MARTVRSQRLDTRNKRLTLPLRKSGYWVPITRGCAIGYRKGRKGGVWLAKYVREGMRREKTIGPADDALDADGVTVLDYGQAQEQARQWFHELAAGTEGGSASPISVKQACEAYIEFLRAERKTADDAEGRLAKHVYPTLGDKQVSTLTHAEIDKWKRGMVRHDDADPDAERRSKDSANRVLSMLKAALNRAFQDDGNHIASDAAWRKVKPFKDVGRARQVHLDAGQSQRLINVCQGAFRKLVTAALLTGARAPHELQPLRVRDFRSDTATLSVDGKTGLRDIVLTQEAVRWFEEITAGREPDALLLPKDDGTVWGKNHHIRPMQEAVAKAKLPKDCTIYSLRHTYASRSIEAGMNLQLLAENMGTSIRMLEVHYGKFIAASRRQLVEEYAFKLGLKPGNVAPMRAEG